jgi:RNA polymerase sigma-70 factor (ECF subfamily)
MPIASGPMPAVMPADPSPRPEFRHVFDREFSFVWNVLRQLGVHANDIEDVAHEVFITVHRHLGTYDPTRPIRPWLFGIATHAASDYRRLARHKREAPDEIAASRQALALVDAAMATMPIERKAVLIMHEMEGYAMPEISASLGVPLNTAYSRLRLARKQFSEAVERLTKGSKP